MPDYNYNVKREAARLGGLSAYGKTPDPVEEAHVRRRLATAKADRALREIGESGVQVNDGQAGHLVGLLLASCGVSGRVSADLEKVVRAAVAEAQGGAR